MPAKLIDGAKLAKQIRAKLKEKTKEMKVKPGLAAVIVGENPASHLYVSFKEKACREVGFYSEKHVLPANSSEEKIIKLIDDLNQSRKIHGIIVQVPLPKGLNEDFITNQILPRKDADGFTIVNLGEMFSGNNVIVPATPKGIIKLIESTGINFEGKHAVVVGRSKIVGKPVAFLLQQKNCTVTMCHSKTKDLAKHTKMADILVVAIGQPKMITGDMVKKNAIVIDVGTTKVDGKLYGDADFDSVKKVASWITPVPGGVGPMTIAMLLENTLECMKLHNL